MATQENKDKHIVNNTSYLKEGRNHNFLEIIPLENLKVLQNQFSSGSDRQDYYTIVLLTSGSITETIGYKTYCFEPNTLYCIPANALHSVDSWSRDVKGFHCTFDVEYFLLCIHNQIKLTQFPFFQLGKTPFMKVSTVERNMLIEIFKKMNIEYSRKKSLNDDLLVRLYLNVLLIEIERIYKHKSDTGNMSIPRQQQIVMQFQELVSQHYLQLRKVSEYADLLYINAHYLNDLVKAITGKPASTYILEQLLMESKSYLIQTNYTVSQIAIALNFSDESYFCRFFKKYTKMTPVEFRQNHHQHSK